MVCLVGNANTALSTEQRHSALLHIDPRLSDMAEKELGVKTEGKLFGNTFMAELRKHTASLTKMESSLKKNPVGFSSGPGRQPWPSQRLPKLLQTQSSGSAIRFSSP